MYRPSQTPRPTESSERIAFARGSAPFWRPVRDFTPYTDHDAEIFRGGRQQQPAGRRQLPFKNPVRKIETLVRQKTGGTKSPTFEKVRRTVRFLPLNRVSEETTKVVVFQGRDHMHVLLHARSSHLCYTSRVSSLGRTRVKLNRVFFPRWFRQARSLGCGFAR